MFFVCYSYILSQRTLSSVGCYAGGFKGFPAFSFVLGSCYAGTYMQVNRKFKIQRRDRNENVKKKGLIIKTTTLHVHETFFYISLPFLHDYDVKMPNFAFYGERKQETKKFYFSF